MQVAVFSTKPYDRRFLDAANMASGGRHCLIYLEPRLSLETALLARGVDSVCAFVNDVADATILEILSGAGMRLLALRSAGFNNVDLAVSSPHWVVHAEC
jgi:D-lactate dehydrogenase